jgi:carboxymethylenebutenolidase
MLTQMRIDNRIDGFLGRPGGADKWPAVIHLHERYGIVQHTTDLAHKLVEAGYVTVVPDLFSRFTGDRQALARGDSRVELCDAEVLQDVDAIVAHLRTLPDVDGSRIAMIGVCQTGRQPVLVSAYRDYLAGIAVMYGAIYNADWEPQPLRPEPIDALLAQVSCPMQGIFGELDNLIPVDNVLRMCNVLASARKSFDIRVYAEAPHGFLNDTMPGRYRAAQTQTAWGQILGFLDTVLNKGWNKERVVWRFESDTSVHYDFSKNRRWE